MSNTCFVIMPIGAQKFGDIEFTAQDLRNRYDDLIREALLAALPTLEITRADDIALSGTITTDILTRIMRSDFVVADVSYPNPNVFYELGLRHACRSGTIIIRDAEAPKPPFDISHLRHFEYQNTPTGLKGLAENFRQYFRQFSSQPDRPDSHFLEIAKLTQFNFPDYASKPEEAASPEIDLLMALMSSPELMTLLVDAPNGQPADPKRILTAFASNPDAAKQVFNALIRGGHLNFPQNKQIKSVTQPRNTKQKGGAKNNV